MSNQENKPPVLRQPLDRNVLVRAEERIAAMIFAAVTVNGAEYFDGIGEPESSELSREIVKDMLHTFRPDLVDLAN